jgi:tRNA(fMet)-specific endonuclease VapC
MRRYLLDTGIMGDFADHRHGVDVRVRDARRQGAKIGTCLPVVGKLFFGVELSASRERNMRQLRLALNGVVFWPFEEGAAEIYGRLAADLRRRGRTIQQIDIQVAAIALNLGDCTVVSSDSDMLAIPGLTVENWAETPTTPKE